MNLGKFNYQSKIIKKEKPLRQLMQWLFNKYIFKFKLLLIYLILNGSIVLRHNFYQLQKF